MRLHRMPDLQLFGRLFMAAALLVGLATNPHFATAHASPMHSSQMQSFVVHVSAVHAAMAQHVVEENANHRPTTGSLHTCCEPTEAVQACLVACAAAACATPILPGAQAALVSPSRLGVQPTTATFLRSRAPDIETPPPKARL